FARPVDPLMDGVPNYPSVISHAMDLGSVSAKLKRGGYASPQALREDVAQVWRNSLLFNGQGTHALPLA
ncbi:Bromodomain-containing protein, partial [Baffinella frigidus]